MPFKIIKLPNGLYSVINRITEHNFSPKGITLSQAQKQLKAISLHYGHLDGAGINGSLKSIMGKGKKISMSLDDLIAEHKKLLKILKKGSKKEQLTEAQDQSQELKKYLKMKGGSMPEDEDENLVYKAMSDSDLHQYFPNAKVLKYSELPRQTPPEDFLKVGEVIYILYESAPNSGHWVSLARGPDAFYYMDSYGNKPDVPLTWIDAETRKALGEDYPTLTKMFSIAKHPVYYNDYDYQSKKDTKVATCGRFATAFLIHFKKYGGDLKSFYKVMQKGDKKTKGDMDDYIASVITE